MAPKYSAESKAPSAALLAEAINSLAKEMAFTPLRIISLFLFAKFPQTPK
jgi:hypothetical protein